MLILGFFMRVLMLRAQILVVVTLLNLGFLMLDLTLIVVLAGRRREGSRDELRAE